MIDESLTPNTQQLNKPLLTASSPVSANKYVQTPDSSPRYSEAGKIYISKEDAEKMRKNNIYYMYLHTAFITLYQSICCWNVFDAYLSLLAKSAGSANSNTWVGSAESVSGVSTLLFALPCGWAADVYDRVRLIRFAGFVGLFASASSAVGFFSDNWVVIFFNMFIWGLFTSLMGTAGEAIFADSCPAGTRSDQTSTKGSLQTAGLAAGPLVMIGVFYFIGDAWTLNSLHFPLLIGCMLGPLGALPCFFMDDLRNYEIERDEPESFLQEKRDRVFSNISALRSRGMTNLTTDLSVNHSTARSVLGSMSINRPRGDSRAVEFMSEIVAEEDEQSRFVQNSDLHDVHDQIEREEARFKQMTPMQRAVPFILTTADFVTEIGAGMTVRFFPLFFINDYNVRPMMLNFIFFAYPLLVTFAIFGCQKMSKLWGRTQISFVFQFCGILSLLAMVVLDDLKLLVVVFFCRCCFQNGAYPLDRSILYDYIPSSSRGKWASIMSLTTMTWSGSAVIGGYLTDGHDYRYTFLITAGIYVVGLCIYSPLLFLVPTAEKNM